MSTPLSLIARSARMLGFRNAMDAGGAKALFYTGTKPAKPSLTTSETLLGTMLLPSPCGALSSLEDLALLELTVPQTILAVASGEIGFIRLTNGAGGVFLDLVVGLVGSGAPAIVNVAQVFSGGEIQLISCTLAD